MTTDFLRLDLPNAKATKALAETIARQITPGDVILLEGPIGAGKTHFCRSLIQALQGTPEDIPSPTFTLVQMYDLPVGELWHADLYRISHIDEIEELGLRSAFDDAICLVEWPDKLEDLVPENALQLSLALSETSDDARIARLSWTDNKWVHRLAGLNT